MIRKLAFRPLVCRRAKVINKATLHNISFSFACFVLSQIICFIRYSTSAIERLCNELMKHTWTFNPEWLLAVPMLHFLRGESHPFEEPDIGGSPRNLAWWGAEKLDIEAFRRSDKQ